VYQRHDIPTDFPPDLPADLERPRLSSAGTLPAVLSEVRDMRRALVVASLITLGILLPRPASAQYGPFYWGAITPWGAYSAAGQYDYPDPYVNVAINGEWWYAGEGGCDPDLPECDGYEDFEWISGFIQGSDGWSYEDPGYGQYFWVDGNGASDAAGFYWIDPYLTPATWLSPVYYNGWIWFDVGGLIQQAAWLNPVCQPDYLRDALSGQYVNYGLEVWSCQEFKNYPPSAYVSYYFTWENVNHVHTVPIDNPYTWAMMSGYTLYGLDRTQDNYYAVQSGNDNSINVTSGYRSPDVQGSLYVPAAKVPHVYGRAADQKAVWWSPGVVPQADWQVLANAASLAGPSYLEPYTYNMCNCSSDSRTHVHTEWPYVR
jgi:hypothetical protein